MLSLERLEQGDLQLQIRMGESDRQFRRMVTAQHALGQSVLLAALTLSAALLGASPRPVTAHAVRRRSHRGGASGIPHR